MPHKTAVLIPSLGREDHVWQTFDNIEAKTPEPHEQLWCYAGEDYENAACSRDIWRIRDDEDPDKRYVTRMNKLVKVIIEDGSFDTVFFGSDDVVHHAGWLEQALKQMDATDKAVVVVNDLHNAAGTQALVRVDYLREGKAVFDNKKVAFHPGYLHNFADNEMFFTAMMQNEVTRAKDSLVEHLHPVFQAPNSRDWDDTYRTAAEGWTHDRELWRKRQIAIAEHFS